MTNKLIEEDIILSAGNIIEVPTVKDKVTNTSWKVELFLDFLLKIVELKWWFFDITLFSVIHNLR